MTGIYILTGPVVSKDMTGFFCFGAHFALWCFEKFKISSV